MKVHICPDGCLWSEGDLALISKALKEYQTLTPSVRRRANKLSKEAQKIAEALLRSMLPK